MTSQISRRDLENLSAYLDEELSPKAQASLETRLEDTPELRAALADLRRVKDLLRTQSRLRAPRSFTLSPEMAGIRRGYRSPPGQYPILRLASLVAVFFFFVVLAGDFFTARLRPATIVVSQADQRAISPPGVPGIGGGGGGGGSEQEFQAQVEPAVEEQASMLVETEASMAMPETGEVTAIPVTPIAEAVFSTPVPSELGHAEDIQSSEKSLMDQTGEGREEPSVWMGISTLRVVEALLFIAALVTGIAALVIRRTAFR